ncbi:hypothetical protein SOVF_119810, partial [Spinacia oleracea]
MADWSEIPEDIYRKIAVEHLENLEDFEAFKEVCSKWRYAVKGVNFCPSKNTQLPWLMLADPPNSPHRRFYSLSKQMFRKFNLPQLDDKEDDDHLRYFSSKGWLVSVSRMNRNITLFDPFSGKVIKPPSVPLDLMESAYEEWDDDDYLCFFWKFILSANSSCCDDFSVAMVFERTRKLAFWKPGEHKWTEPTVDFPTNIVYDVCYFKGEFYAIDNIGKVVAFGSGISKRQPRIVADLLAQGLVSNCSVNLYLVVVESSLLVIHRDVFLLEEEAKENEDYYWTKSFEIFELNVENGEAKRVKCVGDWAIFVGLNSTFSIEATSDIRGCRSNCIYFTDDCCEFYLGSGVSRGGGSDI